MLNIKKSSSVIHVTNLIHPSMHCHWQFLYLKGDPWFGSFALNWYRLYILAGYWIISKKQDSNIIIQFSFVAQLEMKQLTFTKYSMLCQIASNIRDCFPTVSHALITHYIVKLFDDILVHSMKKGNIVNAHSNQDTLMHTFWILYIHIEGGYTKIGNCLLYYLECFMISLIHL